MQKDETNKGYGGQVTTSQWRKPPNTIPHPSVLSLWNTHQCLIIVIGAGCINRCGSQASLRQEKLASCRSMTSAWLMVVDSSASPKLLVKVCLNHSIFLWDKLLCFCKNEPRNQVVCSMQLWWARPGMQIA